ncbi:hypothetical protein L1049_011465 [Liquidambar formosana]|uniref:peptidylprolyl isomerase n=1 Tax=Liquidambar formosana TaxID=63359 RepID=A0AAP0RRU8_LIQFO
MEEVQEQRSPSTGQDDENEIVTENAAFVHGEPSQDENGPPKVDSEVEVLHEKVTKQIIKEGHGQKPSKYATCFLHYRAWTESTQHKFEDTWNEQRPLELILGKEKKEMTGLSLGVSSMKAGERTLLHVGWELGYGKEGSFSFPNVPPMADILYEVELIGFDETKEAIAYMGDDFMFQLFGKYRDMALAVKNPCHLNMAACLIKLKRYEESIGQCSIVLAEDENNVKALFRRGKARAELGQTDAAREDFLKARKYAPEDKAIVRELRLLTEHDKAVYQKQKEIYKGIFGSRPEPKPKRTNWIILIWQWLLSLFFRLFKRERRKAD